MNNDSTELSNDSTAPQLTRRENSPDHSIRADGPVGQGGDANATIHDRTGLYIAIIALLVAGMALGFEISKSMSATEISRLTERNVSQEIGTAVAQAEARMAAQIAESKAVAQAGKEHARIALDEVQRANAQLEAKGLIRGSH